MDDCDVHSEMNRVAFRCYFDQYYDKIRNFCYYKCGDMAQAEDLAQETFIALWEKRETVRIETLAPLLYTIANNLYLNNRKHQQVELRFQQRPQRSADPENPQYLLEVAEFHVRLQQAISALPEGSREVFLMNRIDRLKYAEIAERLGLSVKAVEKRMHQALQALRSLTEKM
jgi:RNA polymerase sigma-70 factor (ECF subfamily)